ncbi:hypothetical protein LCGC14_1367690 [marine sediment metagenome]|uniref:histidine kinase n=1 Tax=marine sediment metagenome TaxID=412755 RepID=A0A0F9N888_9ZZZZ
MKILIVDDKKENLYLLERIIKKMGYEVVMAENGKQALEKLHGDNFKMVISDILMPVMDGYQLCHAVRNNKKFSDLSFVFYTATYVEKEDEELALNMGANKFIRKPMEPEKFMETIKDLLQNTELSQDKPRKDIIKEKKEIFKLYNERLVNKLEQKMLALEKETIERKKVEHNLGERVKELNFLYNTSKLSEQSEISIKQFINQILKFIPPAWQFPDLTCAKIVYNGQEFKTENFRETIWKQKADINEYEKIIGSVEVHYLKKMPDFDEGPFLKEEKDLIYAITKIIGGFTEKKKKEEEIRLQSKIIENMSEGVYLIKFDDETIIYTNPAFEEMFGYNLGEMIGKDAAIVNAPTDKTPEETKDAIMGIIIKTGEWYGELLNVKKDGTPFWCYANVSLFVHPEYGAVIVSVHTDITERKKAEALRERFAEKLENRVKIRTKELNESLEQQKLYQEQLLKISQFKSKFLASMSHELRTPLNSVIGFTDIILEGFYGEINEKQDHYLNNIRSSAFHLLGLINKVLDIAKIESGKTELNIEKFSLTKIIEQSVTTIRPMYEEKNLKFELIGLDEDKFIKADQIRFKEILYNLLSNAVKYTKEGGFKFKVLESENQWEFNVIDTGIGIAEEDFSLIFKEFKRVQSDYVASIEGAGLGLSLTKKLIELHGGNISFTSELGKGTTFTFILPKK